VLIIALIVMSLIAGRLVELQGISRTAYADSAASQQLHTVTLVAKRGAIIDRDGHTLAATVDASDVVADPSQMTNVVDAAQNLSPVLHRSVKSLTAQLSVPGSQYALLSTKPVTPSVGTQIMAMGIPGITTTDTTQRLYPDGSVASNVVGFVGSDGKGLGGLELSYQNKLAGHNGTSSYAVGADGNPIPDGSSTDHPAVPGAGIQLSIQRDIQFEAQQAISRQVAATGALSGTVVVMDPRNGQILALAVAPGFNPNHIAKANPQDLGDPAVSDGYEPGSVNKVITMAAALQDKLVMPESHFVIPPSIKVSDSTFHDAEVHGTEHLTLTGILAKSSNIGAIKVGERLGPERLDYYLRAFGFGRTTGLGLPGETAGILPALANWSGTTLPTLSFGQGVVVSAIQIASVYSTIANNGLRVTPNIVEGSIGQNHRLTPAAPPTERRVISVKTAQELRDMMESVVGPEGTAPAAEIKGYRVAGKTGTAARSNGHGGYSGAGYTATFAGMAPADNPKLVCEVVLDRPLHGYYGGTVAAPVFHQVMSFALQTMGIAPTFTTRPKAKLTW
jgi:cell division protein FtsI (penicillin-binding protein 3)